MPVLGASTRQIQTYGRRRNTQVVSRTVVGEQDENAFRTGVDESPSKPAPPDPADKPAPPRGGLFAGVDFRSTLAWLDSPRKALQERISRGRATENEGASASPAPRAPRDESQVKTPGEEDAAADGSFTHTGELMSNPLPDLGARLSLAPNEPLERLLATVQQKEPLEFTRVLEQSAAGTQPIKVGEASYSEVFKLGTGRHSAVVKVIPLLGSADAELPAQSAMDDVRREIAITATLAKLRDTHNGAHFVRLQRACVVRGAYPDSLLRAWDAYKAEFGDRSENRRPGVFGTSQLYALIMMDDAGSELEQDVPASWVRSAAIFWQVAFALADAEQRVQFEHRDLHMGNILVAPAAAHAARSDEDERVPEVYRPAQAGVRATLIDYTLSRIDAHGETLAYAFDDPALFEGRGDAQYDVYRDMQRLTAGDWQRFHPVTNVLWLHFLVQRLLGAHDAPAEDDAAEYDAYTSLLICEQLAGEAIELQRSAAPKRSVSTRSKRRSIQRGPDAWKATVHRHLHTPIDSAQALVQMATPSTGSTPPHIF